MARHHWMEQKRWAKRAEEASRDAGLAACLPWPQPQAQLPGKSLITQSSLSPLLVGTGPLGVPPCCLLPSLLARQLTLTQLLPVGAKLSRCSNRPETP